jgi:hypothetical protein
MEQFSVVDRYGKRCLLYKEMVSKNNPGGLKSVCVVRKQVLHYENAAHPEHIKLFEQFLAVRPKSVSRFYLQPSKNPTNSVWYTSRPLGKNSLSKFLAQICADAGIEGKKTNHSLRATCATRLYQAGVEEQQIMERTGHRSVAGVRAYKRTSDIQIANCSAVLDCEENVEQIHASGRSVKNFVFNNCTVTINN